ncbi:MAG: hypothetical protein L0211_00745 [Planctomycetaceae bacterium]|nr:hypothetical protein [Planctomycetaceae bacterium]
MSDSSPRALPLHARLSPREGGRLDSHQRIAAAFPQAVIDWQRGDRAVQDTIDYVTSIGVPEAIIAPARRQFGHTAHISLSFPPWPGQVATFCVFQVQPQASDWIRVDAEPFDLGFLKHAAVEIGAILDCHCFLQSDMLRGIASCSMRGAVPDPIAAARCHYDASNYRTIDLVELSDWRRTVRDAALAWLATQDNVSWRAKTMAGFDSPAAYADALVAELDAISPVRRIWSIRMPTPFRGAMLLDQGEWHTSINIRAVASGPID